MGTCLQTSPLLKLLFRLLAPVVNTTFLMVLTLSHDATHARSVTTVHLLLHIPFLALQATTLAQKEMLLALNVQQALLAPSPTWHQ